MLICLILMINIIYLFSLSSVISMFTPQSTPRLVYKHLMGSVRDIPAIRSKLCHLGKMTELSTTSAKSDNDYKLKIPPFSIMLYICLSIKVSNSSLLLMLVIISLIEISVLIRRSTIIFLSNPKSYSKL